MDSIHFRARGRQRALIGSAHGDRNQGDMGCDFGAKRGSNPGALAGMERAKYFGNSCIQISLEALWQCTISSAP